MGVNYGGSPGLFLYMLKLTQNEATHSGKKGTDWNRSGGGGSGNGVNCPGARSILLMFHTAGWDLAWDKRATRPEGGRWGSRRGSKWVFLVAVSPVPGSGGPSPERETMWVTAHPPGNRGMWQGGAGLWLRGLGLCELPARCVEAPSDSQMGFPLWGWRQGYPPLGRHWGGSPAEL